MIVEVTALIALVLYPCCPLGYWLDSRLPALRGPRKTPLTSERSPHNEGFVRAIKKMRSETEPHASILDRIIILLREGLNSPPVKRR